MTFRGLDLQQVEEDFFCGLAYNNNLAMIDALSRAKLNWPHTHLIMVLYDVSLFSCNIDTNLL